MKTKASSVWMLFERLVKSTMKLLAVVALAGVMPAAAFAQDSITVANPSFETGYDTNWPHASAIPGWAYSVFPVGINDATGPYWDNGGAVDGTYVGLMQGDGLLGQGQSGFQVGETYWIQLFANARIDTDTPDLTVFHSASTAGGAAIVSYINITPVDTNGTAGTGNPFTFINVPFTAATNEGALNLLKGAHNGGAATLLLDGISIIRRSPNDVVVANPSFEASGTNQVAPGYIPVVAGWTKLGGGMLINQTGGAFADNGAIPDGGNVLCLQSGVSVSQTLHDLSPGMNYQLSLYVNSRESTATPSALVKIGGSTAFSGAVTSVGGSNPYQTLTYTFTAASTNATLTISNSTATVTDSTLLVDNVRVIKQSDSITLANPSFETGYNPSFPHYGAIPGWNASMVGLGINDATGPFWDNGATVDSAYAGFVQDSGLLGQPTSGFQVGETYWIQFFANARSAEADTPEITVFESASTAGGAPLVSGINITPAGGANPFTLINVPFTAAATSGDLNLLKSEHSSGGSTLLLDGFSIIRRSTNDIVIANPSFEASGTGQAAPGVVGVVAGWTLSGPGGPPIINQTGGPYLDSGEVVPDGNNVLVIQGVCDYSQTLHGLTVGETYRLTLSVNGRGGAQPTALITIDGNTAYNAPVPQLGSSAYHFISYDFIASAADVTLAIGQTTGTSYFVDNVRVFAPAKIAPTVTTQPAGATRYVGGAVTFTAAVTGYPTPQLQWKHNGNIITDETNATLSLSNLQLADAGGYVLHATNSAGFADTTTATLNVLTPSGYSSQVLANNPMGYWRFSDGGGTNAYDYIGGNDAVDPLGQPLQAGPRPPAFSGYESTNTAPVLNGTNQGYASTAPLFNGLSDFTLMGWFKIDPSQYPFSHPDGRASLFGQQWAAELGFYQGTNLYFYSQGIDQTIFVTSGFAPGAWHFVAVVSDQGANTTTVYLDGVAAGTASACPGTTQPYLFSIGKNVSNIPSIPSFFPGSIDEVAAFDHVLSVSAIQDIYNGAGAGFSVSISWQGGSLQITWPVGQLESATNISGPWQSEPTAVSPWLVTPGGAKKFYRAVVP
jgi:hypothetical protein